jgi:hypothetical protein
VNNSFHTESTDKYTQLRNELKHFKNHMKLQLEEINNQNKQQMEKLNTLNSQCKFLGF